jgi:hypothetical protein
MGTRALTFVYEESKTGEKPEAIINMYRQFDGYPTGHGSELAEFLNSGRVVNGLDGIGKDLQFNGMGCLAAQLVAHFKNESGGFYLYPTSAEDCGQDYEYHVYNIDGELRIKIMDCGCNMFGMTQDDTYAPLFEGTLGQFKKYCAAEMYDKVEINPPKTVFDGSQVGQDWLKSVLRDGIATVVFEKNDGTERTMKCTLSKEIVPQVVSENVKKVRAVAVDSLPVYDVEAQGWRSFRWDSIKSVEI